MFGIRDIHRAGLVILLGIALLAATATAGCGGEDDDSGDTSAEISTEQETPSENRGAEGSEGDSDGGSDEKDSAKRAANAEDAVAAAPEVEKIGKPPIRKGGDNSIQRFGEEADEGDANEIAAVLSGFLNARADGDWDGACALMSEGVTEGLEQLAQQAPENAEKLTCERFLATSSRHLPKKMLRKLAEVRLGSVRVEDDRGFAIFKSGDNRWQFMPMALEDGAWKVGAIAASYLP